MGNKRLYEIMQEKERLYAKEDFNDEDGILLGELEGEFADMDGWNAEADAETMLNGLGITSEFHDMYMKDLDGNQKVKVLLAQALFGDPDISYFSSWFKTNKWISSKRWFNIDHF